MKNKPIQENLTVGFLTPGWPLNKFHNGIVTYVQNILYGLENKANGVVLATQLIGEETEGKSIDVSKYLKNQNLWQKLIIKITSRLGFNGAKKIRYQAGASSNAKKIQCALQSLATPLDILEMEESFGTPYFLTKLTTVPIVTRIHGPWFTMGEILQVSNDWDYQLRVFYEGEAIKQSAGITAPSLDVLEQVRAYYDIELPHASVIPNPVPEVDASKRWQLQSSQRPYILFVGRFDLHKGGDLMLDAFNSIAQQYGEIDLLFVGPDRGVLINGERLNCTQYVEKFIVDHAIKSRIQFVGNCDPERIADLRKKSLVTVVCSRYENFPLSLLEALSAGCPTVATAVGGIKEIVVNDYNGLLASASPASIAEQVIILMKDTEKMQRLSRNAIEDCKKRFSPEVVAAQTLDYFRSVLERNANKPN